VKTASRFVALLCLLGTMTPGHGSEPPPGVLQLEPRPAPDLRLADADGTRIDIRSYRGQWVMVHFWAAWCGPCQREMPTVQRMAAQLVPAYLQLIMVNTAETDDDVFLFLSSVAPDLTTYMDRDGAVTNAWQPRGLPSSFLVDPEGRIRYVALGGRAWDQPAYLEFLRGLKARR
jgi:thiol-disulfide isomerase/thioredoxin